MARLVGKKNGNAVKGQGKKGGARNVVSNQVKVARKAARTKFLSKPRVTTLDPPDADVESPSLADLEEEAENLAEDNFFADESDDEPTVE